MVKYRYVVCRYADDYYDMGEGKFYDSYNDCKKAINGDTELLEKLEWLEQNKHTFDKFKDENGIVYLVVSYC